MSPTIEVAIPCFNEAQTIGKVVADFRRTVPGARIVVYDNTSTDGTAQAAREAGAEVRRVNRRGKGFVTQAIFETSRADFVLMVDGDDTYEAEDASTLLGPLLTSEADMTIGTRLEYAGDGSFRRFHRFGNRMITGLLNLAFGTSFRDLLSGYRGFNRRVLDHVPLLSGGCETETELIVQALELGCVVCDRPIRYRNRPAGSMSKLRKIRDGYRIITTIVILLRDHRPMMVFGAGAAVLGALGLAGWIAGMTVAPQLRAGGVALVAMALALVLAGLVLNTINVRFQEMQSLLRRTGRAPRTSRQMPEQDAISYADSSDSVTP
jgi:hypothetical protein